MLSQFMHAPTSTHWGAVKHLLCYLNGTRDHGISLQANSPLSLHCCTDADWLAILTAALYRGLYYFSWGQPNHLVFLQVAICGSFLRRS